MICYIHIVVTLADPGYYCIGGAYTSNPTDGVTGDICPRGGYCPVGTDIPVSCPAGTYNNETGGKTENSCFECDAGYYCSGTNNPYPTGGCAAGFYCTGGAATPYQFATSPGTYSVVASSSPIACPEGTYQPQWNSSACFPCDAGIYCPNASMTSLIVCPKGSYCPEGSSVPSRCPEGTYNDRTALTNSSCITCTAGFYCSSKGLEQVSGPCTAGYICTGGATLPAPSVGDSWGSICPIGSYCPAGSFSATPCPPGTYSNQLGLTNATDCTSCDAGYYCNATGLTAPQGLCSAGYYCSGGASVSDPSDSVSGMTIVFVYVLIRFRRAVSCWPLLSSWNRQSAFLRQWYVQQHYRLVCLQAMSCWILLCFPLDISATMSCWKLL